ncbi:MAG: hypothetical protein NTW28_35880 [Candidatus Solibacter sp.]|nr:hypothetical protein [Candidatus Solibacter sp.]
MAAKRHFFISRACEDADYAKWVAQVLEAEGYHRRDAELEALRQLLEA